MDKPQPHYLLAPNPLFPGLSRAEKDFMRGDPFLEMDLTARIGPVFSPAFDLLETAETYLLLADLPGLEIADLDIELTATSVTITGERPGDALDETSACHALERRFGTFLRRFDLPEGVDGAGSRARMANGVLTLALPKRLQDLPDC
ncbi:MAG: Hsp20/alpha crystallin family protein [Holophaga sp.]|nr:Hsp20/alpha crystallin family protein [Holophaga sp.]